MKKLLLTALCVASIVSYLEAATASLVYQNDYIEETELWASIVTCTDYKKLIETDYCNNINLIANGKTVNVYLDTPWASPTTTNTNGAANTSFPQTPTVGEANNLGINGVNLTVKKGGILAPYYYGVDYDGEKNQRGSEIGFAYGNVTIEDGGKLYIGNLRINSTPNSAAKFTVENGGIFTVGGEFNLGNASSTVEQVLRIEGYDNDEKIINVRRLFFVGNENSTFENVQGGKLEFVSDAKGISTMYVSEDIRNFSGLIEVDFTNLKWDESWGNEKKFNLITATERDAPLLTDWIINETLGFIKGAEGNFGADNRNLWVTITKDSVIPEPSTYAAIFGALALAFVAYRRRK